ncbi:MAG: hypothetical protein K8I02_11395, partial [Candidatus Methylomirabilis sp.]|nr:hypothetical protein [Deltaproteobacteria bacterium]
HYRLPFAPDFYYPQGKPSLWRRLGPHLWEPCGLIDHSGLHTPLGRFVNHALVISHEDFRYDFEMLRAVPGGVEALETALRGVLDGTHPDAETISRLVEDPGYHKRLLAALAAWRADPGSTEPFHLLPPSPEHAEAYRAYDHFHSLAGFLRYCLTL